MDQRLIDDYVLLIAHNAYIRRVWNDLLIDAQRAGDPRLVELCQRTIKGFDYMMWPD